MADHKHIKGDLSQATITKFKDGVTETYRAWVEPTIVHYAHGSIVAIYSEKGKVGELKVVVCKNKEGYGDCITIGKSYIVIDEDETSYTIKDNDDEKITLFKWRFHTIAEGFAAKEVTVTLENASIDNLKPKEEPQVNPYAIFEYSRTYHYPTKYGIKTVTIEGATELRVSKTGHHYLTTKTGEKEIMPPGWLRISVDAEKWSIAPGIN